MSRLRRLQYWYWIQRETHLLLLGVRDTVDHVVELVPHGLGCDTGGSRTEVLLIESRS